MTQCSLKIGLSGLTFTIICKRPFHTFFENQSAPLGRTPDLNWQKTVEGMNLIEHFGLLNRLEELLESQREEEKNQKLQKWEDWKAHIKHSFGNCEDKLADLKSKGDPKDKKDIEEQIALNKVRSWSFIIIIVSVLLWCILP